jgi:ribosomal protein S18 acetylase RimI-like enzyme
LINGAYRGESKAGWTTEAFMLEVNEPNKELTEILLDSTNTLLKLQKMTNFSLCFTNCKENQLYLGMLTVSPQLQNGGIGAHYWLKLIYMQNNWVF